VSMERLSCIIKGSHVSEKTECVGEAAKQFVFKVEKTATKQEVKQSIELFFNVKVEKVNLLCCKGKLKHFKQRLGRTKSWKKAYVTLVDKDAQIKFAEME